MLILSPKLYYNTYFTNRVEGCGGSVMVNGQDRKDVSLKHYLRVSCYIQQDDELRPLLTVDEAMMMAAHLKLGYGVANITKKQQVQ